MVVSRNRSAYLHLFPRWSAAPSQRDEGARDALGFQRYATEFAEHILPEITVLTIRARQYSFICWAIKKIENEAQKRWAADRPMTNNEFVTLYNRFEKILALVEAVRHQDESTCSWIGQRKTRHVVANDLKVFGLDFQLIAAEQRGGGLAQYQTSMVSLGLLKWDIEKCPLVTTEKGQELAEALGRAIKSYAPQIEGFCLDVNNEKISRDQLARWGKRLCLSEMTRSEARILRPLIVNAEREVTLRTLRQIPRWLDFDETSLLQSFYNYPDRQGRAFDLKQVQYYQYHFNACLTIFYSLFNSFSELGQSRKRNEIVRAWLQTAKLSNNSTLTQVAPRTKTPESLTDGQLSLDNAMAWINALRLLRTVWDAAKKQPDIYATAPKVESLALYEVGELLNRFETSRISDFLNELIFLLLEKHVRVFSSKNKSPWMSLSGDEITVHEFDTWKTRGNPYQVHVNSLRSLVRDLERSHD